MNNYHSKPVERLFKAMLSLKTTEECAMLFEDICTVNEILDMAQRLEVAMMLDEGKVYQDISKETGVSTATISRVSKCLNYGRGGYRTAIDRLKALEEDQ